MNTTLQNQETEFKNMENSGLKISRIAEKLERSGFEISIVENMQIKAWDIVVSKGDISTSSYFINFESSTLETIIAENNGLFDEILLDAEFEIEEKFQSLRDASISQD